MWWNTYLSLRYEDKSIHAPRYQHDVTATLTESTQVLCDVIHMLLHSTALCRNNIARGGPRDLRRRVANQGFERQRGSVYGKRPCEVKLCQWWAVKACGGDGGGAPHVLNFGTAQRWMIQSAARWLHPPRKDPDTHCVGAWVGPRARWDVSRRQARAPVSVTLRTELYRSLCGYVTHLQIVRDWSVCSHGRFVGSCVTQWASHCSPLPGGADAFRNLNSSADVRSQNNLKSQNPNEKFALLFEIE
jgi:hypothetical protein